MDKDNCLTRDLYYWKERTHARKLFSDLRKCVPLSLTHTHTFKANRLMGKCTQKGPSYTQATFTISLGRQRDETLVLVFTGHADNCSTPSTVPHFDFWICGNMMTSQKEALLLSIDKQRPSQQSPSPTSLLPTPFSRTTQHLCNLGHFLPPPVHTQE